MNPILRGGIFVVGLIAGFLGLVFLFLVFRYLPLWGTQESLFILVYWILTYAAFGAALTAFVPRERIAKFVAGVGGAVSAFFALGIPYYLLIGNGANGIYMAMILIIILPVQVAGAGGFLYVGRKLTRHTSST